MGKGHRVRNLRAAKVALRDADLARRRSEPTAIHVICPVTDRFVDAGISADVVSYHGNNKILGARFECPECGGMHEWDDEAAVLNT